MLDEPVMFQLWYTLYYFKEPQFIRFLQRIKASPVSTPAALRRIDTFLELHKNSPAA